MRPEKDISQKHRDAQTYGTEVVELLRCDGAVKEIHPHHHQAGDVEQVEHQFGPGILQAEMPYAEKHDPYGEDSGHGGDPHIEDFTFFLESDSHVLVYCVICDSSIIRRFLE